MESDPEDTKSQMAQNPSTPTHKHKKKRKKVAPVQATIQVFPENPGKIPPIVGYFPTGFDPTKNPNPNSTQVGLFRHAEKPKRFELVVTPNGSNVDFVGTSYSGPDALVGEQGLNNALGILDKATQTLKIVPIVSNKIFRLEPRVRGHNYFVEDPEDSVMKEELTGQEKADKQLELHNLFGTKKSIRENKKLRALKQEDGPDSQKDLEAKIKQVVPNKEALEGTEGHISRRIPPFNESATTPQEAYPLDKIIVAGEWGFLQDIYELLQGGAKISGDAFPRFVRNRIHKLQDIQDEEEKIKLSCIFTYITHLVKFKDQHSMDGISSAKGHRIPNIIYNKFSTMFASDSKRLSQETIDLLISHVLVLTLFVDEFQTEVSDIAKDLRMTSFTLVKHYENMGCKLIRKNNLPTATLPVPLQFPKLEPKRKKRGTR